ncbi:leucine-rich repeat-containing protein 17 [Pristis pectinata]|uniref:leucine-rich repeat-containing protein 17 n=1 Tax=Pristis pectinata TaxID=685728 RepID=UPI00223CC609|nr:leucine-rich repeat-containing protein 17 [Pristis pectinata]XP_051890010.1 leucine-rich repeat-containing protein 17 [Pristis pectinata]
MQVVRIIMLLLLCRAAEFRKRRNGSYRNRLRNCGENCLRESSNHVKRFSQFLRTICSESLYENEKLLTCQDKQLITVPRNLPEDVIHLQLAGNKIESLKNFTFSTLKNLKSLDLQRNAITNIEADAFEGLDELETLLLQHNELRFIPEDIFIPIPKLEYLRIYGNPWDCNCELEQMVRKLQIPGQRNLGSLAKCKTPKGLAGYKLKTINVSLLCSEDLLPAPIQTLPDSTECNIYLFPKSRIDCQNKDLSKVPTSIPAEVLEIDLSRNKIKQLDAKNFMNFKELEILNLSNNAIEYINPAAFVGLLRLKELDLSENHLDNFEYGVLEHLYFIERIILTRNRWKCDYQIHYLAYWLQVHYTVKSEGLECTEPSEYEGWTVQKYIKKYYEGCPKEKGVADFDTYDSDKLEEEETRRIP